MYLNMIERFITWCLNNRFLVLLATFIIIIGGIQAIRNIPVDAIPDIGENQQIVFVDWPGRDALTIENQITYPLSTRLQGIPGVKTIRASSEFGFAMIYVVFYDNIDFYWSRTRLLEKIQEASKILPEGVVPVLGPDATGLGQVFWYTVEGNGYSLAHLRSIQDFYIKYQLQSVEGVSEVASIGGFVKQYQIEIDPNRLATYGIKFSDVFDAVRISNIDVGAKVIERGGMEYIIRGVGFLQSIEDLHNISVGARNGTPIFLKDVARIQIGPEFRRGALDKAGKEVVGGVVIIRYKENPLKVIKKIKEKIIELSPGLPKGVKIVPFYDRTELVNRVINTLTDTLIQEIIFCIIVVLFLLGHLRSAIVISLGLPVAVIISFIIMYFLKIDSNIMSLSGIAIAIGTLVDAGIVMTENIHRHSVLYKEKNRIELILDSAKEVGPAIVTGILSTIISFIPVFALESQEGKLFKPLAFTKTFALGASIIVALSLTLVLSFYFLRGRMRPVEENPVTGFLLRIYEKILRWVLKNRIKFLLIPFAIIATAIFLGTRIGSEFMPYFDEGTILFMPVVAPSVSLTEAMKIMQIQDSIIKTFPEVEEVVGKLGRAETATDPAPIEMFETIISLKEKKLWRKGMTKQKIIHSLDSLLKFPGVSNIWTQPIVNRIDMLSTGIRTPVGVKIFGTNVDTLQILAEQIKEIVQSIKGAEDLYAEKITGKPYIEIIPDRRKIARYGLNIQDVMEIVEMAIGGENLTTFYEGRERYPVRIRIARELRDTPEKLSRIFIPTVDGGYVQLGNVAEIHITEGPAMINSENGMLRAYVLVNVRGRDLMGFVKEASRIVAQKMSDKIPSGYSIQWSGQFENLLRAQRKLFVLIPLSLLIIYVINFLNFKSHRKSLTIFSTVPVTFAGGIILLALYGFNFSTAVWVGFIAVFGIADDDAILITTYLDQVFARKRPKTKKEVIEATIEAGKARFRPAFMTVTTTFLALLPIFIFGGTGKEIMLPMAIPSFGGMIVHIITWFIVPAIYSRFEERKTQS
ncbi:MAG: efflux RND transporter permease subunit [bacterium]